MEFSVSVGMTLFVEGIWSLMKYFPKNILQI